ncbi:hypothetical protein COY95_01315, partial [Candidatus Woesearchaeota archaeon CG_4_10_14_0_8_um_filter_47_5]
GTDAFAYNKWTRLLAPHGLSLERLVQYHLGTQNGGRVMRRWADFLEGNGITIYTGTKSTDIIKIGDDPAQARFRIHTNNPDHPTITARYVILARGRHKEHEGAEAPERVWKSLGAEWVYGPADTGLRIEFDNRALLPMVEDGLYDVKIRPLRHCIPTGDKIRLFCGSPLGGSLYQEFLTQRGIKRVIVNGVSDPSMYGTKPANFAVLETIQLKSPYVDPVK